jgi:LuxR family maltose regulon positive regulatory protein
MAELLRRAARAGIEPAEARKLLAAFEGMNGAGAAAAPDTPAPLTKREEEVLALIAAGYSNKQIAGELVISLGTVKRHISNIYRKLGVRRRTQAVARARELEEELGTDGSRKIQP